jgi:hypothetical protein
MTKKQRAARIKEILAGDLVPEIGGKLFIEVHACSKDCLLVEVLHDRAPGKQVYVKVQVIEPDVVKTIFEALTAEDAGEGGAGAHRQ